MQNGGSTILITGASSGFGKVTSELLAERGYRVFGTSRNPSKVSDAPKNVKILELDITSYESVNSCVTTLLSETNGKLDALINNAGMTTLGAVE
jgi:NADP-dependent 3-hydroxy acid dehydrogenase YdfG